MSRSRRKRPSGRNRDLEIELDKLERFDPGKVGDTVLLLVALLVLTQALWNAPGITRPYPGSSVALGGLIAILSVVPMMGRVVGPKLRFAHYLGVGLLFWLGLSSLFSVDRFLSQQTLAMWVGAIGFFVLVSSATSSLLRWRSFVRGLCLSVTVLCVRALTSISEKGELTGTFSNHDTFSVAPLIAFFLALTQIESRNVLVRNLSRACAGLFVLTIIRTSSRAAIVGLFLGTMIAVLIPKNKQVTADPEERPRRLGLLAFACLVPMLGAFFGMFSPLVGRARELSAGADAQGVTMRMDVLMHGLDAARAHPVLGSGPGTFALAYQEFRPPSILPDYIFVNVAHNDFIEVLVEFGLVGFVLVSAQLVLGFFRGARLMRSGMLTWETRCLCGGVAALLGFGLLNFLVPIPCLLFLAATLIGLLQGMPGASRLPRAERSRILSLAAPVALFGWGVWALVFGVKASMVQRESYHSQQLTKALRWEEAIPPLTTALRLQPANASLLLARGQLRHQLSKFQKSPDLARLAEGDLSEAARISPRDQKVLSALVTFYKTNQDWAKAEQAYVRYSKMRPYDQNRAMGLCRILLAEGKYEDAAQTLYSQALDQPEARKTLVSILVELERLRPGRATALFESWLQQAGGADAGIGLLKTCLEEALKHSDRSVVHRLLELALQKLPEDTKVLYLGYQACKTTSDMGQMKLFRSKLLAMDPKNLKEAEYVDLVRVDWARTQPDYFSKGPTFRTLSARLKSNPKSLPVRLALSEVLLRLNEADTATELVTRGLELFPDNPALLARMGSCVAKQGLPDLARDYFEQALKAEPGNREALYGLRR